uniref:Bm10919 n=3 Tax=Brugia TaxID=6278 RepID=A0A0H5SR00_BRUMA|nr:Bm10919 [Brugia malayi]
MLINNGAVNFVITPSTLAFHFFMEELDSCVVEALSKAARILSDESDYPISDSLSATSSFSESLTQVHSTAPTPSQSQLPVSPFFIVHNETAHTSTELLPPQVPSTASLNNHIGKRHVCGDCGKAFPYLSILESHKRCHTGEKPFDCRFCEKKFAQKATLQVHERTHTGERPYKCKYCDKTFAQYGTKTVHEKSAHLGIRNYKCPKCNKCLSSPSALYTHKKTHGEKTLQCDYCPKTFALKNYLKLHVKQVHEQSDRKHICHYCDKSFAYAGSLQVHVRTHTGERPYVCRFCPKAFASQGNLQSHERTHTGERPYTCVQCGRSFIQKSQLTAHEATHQYQPGISPETVQNKKATEYVCKYCGKRYAYASSLYVHTRLHTGERPFRCSFCDKTFTNQGNMQVHQRVHTGEKPYKCNACEKSYAQKVGLKIHLEQCQKYLNCQQQTSPNAEMDSAKTLDSLLPRYLSLPDGIAVAALQYPTSPSVSSVRDLTSPSLGLKLSTLPVTTTAYNTTTLNVNDGIMDHLGRNDTLTSITSEQVVKYGNETTETKQSAFHGVIPDPYKNTLLDPYDSQLHAYKQLLEGGNSPGSLFSQQMILQSQQLQLFLQCPEQWCSVLTQPISVYPPISTLPTLNSTSQQSTPHLTTINISNDFTPTSAKHEPAMHV